MTALAGESLARPRPDSRRYVRVAWLLAGLGGVALSRAAANGNGAPSAFGAGAAFGAATLGLAWLDGWRPRIPAARGLAVSLAVGLAGGLVLVALPELTGGGGAIGLGMRPQPFAAWVLVTLLVSAGEEVLIRGALLDAVEAAFGLPVAIGLSGLAFALVHAPLYGWGVLPLDLAAGVWLAGLRLTGGGLAAPIVAHALADLASWWL
ncbi:MAG TPA: CPBP family intramembrane glutamic endopeptidase [Candidatus Limnocylindria bacterium]|nr:CPBP family intramembrane glutamic endopeptidase [Candidatus Limnocylindria bacterium]